MVEPLPITKLKILGTSLSASTSLQIFCTAIAQRAVDEDGFHIVVFPHRTAPEKRHDIFLEIAKKLKRSKIKCVVTTDVTDTKKELYFGFNFKFTICKKCNGTGFC